MSDMSQKVKTVHLRPITASNFRECVELKVAPHQSGFVADNMKSLAQAYVYESMTPMGIYDPEHRGHREPTAAMRGFLMYEVVSV